MTNQTLTTGKTYKWKWEERSWFTVTKIENGTVTLRNDKDAISYTSLSKLENSLSLNFLRER